jgi:uncharacterized iron-regulated membrane protein
MKGIFRSVHKWLSIPLGIFITLICFSGASLIFEKEITEAINHDLYYVANSSNRALPVGELAAKVASSLPDGTTITAVTISSDPTRAYQMATSQQETLLVDQYSGEVKGSVERPAFFEKMFMLHRWLLCKPAEEGISWGKLIVGIATIALVFILITGLLMWLTNRKKPLTRSLKISVTKGRARFWHDLHVGGGIYVTIFVLAMALTGLTWSFSWYRTGFYSMFGVEAPAGGHGGHGGQGNRGGHGKPDGKWGNRGGEHKGNRGGNHKGFGHEAADNQGDAYACWQTMVDKVVATVPDYQQLTVADGKVSVIPEGRNSLRATDDYNFNATGTKITSTEMYADKDKAAKMRGTIYGIHTGSWGGLTTRIIYFIAALIGGTLPLTGYYLWIKKRRRKNQAKA